MSLPALQGLRERFPTSRIAVLARPGIAGLYMRESFCDEAITYDAPRGWRGWNQKWRIASDLRGRKFDCAILLQNAFESAALMRIANIPVRIGYSRDARGWLLTSPIPVPARGETPPHQRFYYLELLKRARLIDCYSVESPVRFSYVAAARAAGREKFAAAHIATRIIGISPGAAYGGAKRWLPERFAETAVHVAQERNASVAVFGTAAELKICETVERRVLAAGVTCANFAGSVNISEFVDLAAACELFLTNDSGAMHVASALGVPTVAVFGATDDFATGPVGAASRVVREPVECSPCLLRECPIDHRCMTEVSATRVSEVALSLLK